MFSEEALEAEVRMPEAAKNSITKKFSNRNNNGFNKYIIHFVRSSIFNYLFHKAKILIAYYSSPSLMNYITVTV